MISLDGVVLNDSMIWEERHRSDSVAQSTRRTLGGSLVAFAAALDKGAPITLRATTSFGWLTKSVVDQLIARAAVPGAVYTLVYGAESFSVMFRHEDDPALDLEPNLARQTHDADDYFTGAIKLLTV